MINLVSGCINKPFYLEMYVTLAEISLRVMIKRYQNLLQVQLLKEYS